MTSSYANREHGKGDGFAFAETRNPERKNMSQATATQWHPYDEPPDNARTIRLRFDPTGERDCDGYYNSRLGGYFKLHSQSIRFEPVHPKEWSEVADKLTR